MAYTGGLAATFNARRGPATEAALKAAAQEMINGLKDEKPLGLRGGYTSGAFVTGFNLNSIFATDVLRGPSGTMVIFVSTDNPVALYWEMGHYNIFTRKYERQERWGPTASRKSEDAMNAYRRVYARAMGA